LLDPLALRMSSLLEKFKDQSVRSIHEADYTPTLKSPVTGGSARAVRSRILEGDDAPPLKLLKPAMDSLTTSPDPVAQCQLIKSAIVQGFDDLAGDAVGKERK
jgi:hypothetical protein